MKPLDSRFPDSELTPTIKELKAWLSQFPDNTAVAIGYESQVKPMNLDSSSFEVVDDLDCGVQVSQFGKPEPIVVLDVDD